MRSATHDRSSVLGIAGVLSLGVVGLSGCGGSSGDDGLFQPSGTQDAAGAGGSATNGGEAGASTGLGGTLGVAGMSGMAGSLGGASGHSAAGRGGAGQGGESGHSGGASPQGAGGNPGAGGQGEGGSAGGSGVGGGSGKPGTGGGGGSPGMGGASGSPGIGGGGGLGIGGNAGASPVGQGGFAGSGSPLGGMTSAGGVGGSSAGNAGTGALGGQAGTSSVGGNANGGKGGVSATGGGAGIGGSTGGACNPGDPTTDRDGDGYTAMQGDCNDCDPDINPGAADILRVDASGNALPPNEQVDSDCDGQLPTATDSCDQNLAVDDATAQDGAFAMEICRVRDAVKRTWGIIDASYTAIDGVALPAGTGPAGHGLLSGFGPNVMPRKGSRVLGLSSGTARQPTDPGYLNVSGDQKNYSSNELPGFSTAVGWPACPAIIPGKPYDSIMLEVVIQVPTNARSFRYRSKFYTYEMPDYICSEYNDFAVTLMSPAPADVDQIARNILLGAGNRPIGPNSELIDECLTGTYGAPPMTQTYACPAGTSEELGTGFDLPTPHGATSWLETSANVVPGSQITLAFAVWDSGDGMFDSTILFDDFRWSDVAVSGTSTVKN